MSHFNEYLNIPDITLLTDFARQHGIKQVYKRGEYFCRAGEVCTRIAYIEEGGFAYRTTDEAGQRHTIGFNFAHDFVNDYQSFSSQQPAVINTVALKNSTVYEFGYEDFETFCHQSNRHLRLKQHIAESLFRMTYNRMISLYNSTPRQRYESLLKHFPDIFQQTNLNEIASFLHISPFTLSRIRRKITFGEDKR